MHSNYYCGTGNLEWPTFEDRWCATDIAFYEPGGGCHLY